MRSTTSSAPVTLDDLIEAAFERASLVTTDGKVAAELASRTVARWLARTGRLDLVRLLRSQAGGSAIRPGARSGQYARAA